MFPIIMKRNQKKYENTTVNDKTPEICGFRGRACRQMNKSEGANRMLCNNCSLAEMTTDFMSNAGFIIMKDCLETRGYNPTDEQLVELIEIYEDCQEWDGDTMITGNTYDEIEDFVQHSSVIDDVMK